jgi:hypothetical protein
MRSFSAKKIKLLDVLFYGLALYPLLKFNLSSSLLIGLLVVIFFNSYKRNTFRISKKRIIAFFVFALYFILALISISYSYDKADAFKRITRLTPLLIIPAALLFCKIEVGIAQRTQILNVFLLSNFLYVGILFYAYSISSNQVGISGFSFTQALSNRDDFQLILDQCFGTDTFFIHKAYFSMGFVVLTIFSLLQFLTVDKVKKSIRFLYIFSFFFFSYLILSVFSFPNVVSLLISVVVVMYYTKINQGLNKRLIALVALVSISTIASFYFKYNDIDVKRGVNFIESIVANKSVELNDPRIEIYANIKSIYNKASINDVLFGFGVGDVDSLLNNESNLRLSKSKSKNMLLFSEEFNDDYWHKNNIDVVQNKLMSPLKTLKADVLTEKGSSEIRSFNISKKIEGNAFEILTFSVYAQKGSAKDLVLRMGSVDNRVVFNLEDGTYKAFNKEIKANMSKEGEWYRCAITSKVDTEFLLILGVSNSKNEYKYIGNKKNIYIWGAQLEAGNAMTAYENNNTELLTYIADRRLNSHNNYLYFLLSAGLLGLISFIGSIIALFYVSLKNKNIYQVTFCVIIAINFFTENILSRHWGLVCISLMLLIFFSNNNKPLESETKENLF